MAISFNTGTTGSLAAAAHTTAFTFTVPAGVHAGDVMFVSVNILTFTPTTFSVSTPSSGGGSWTGLGSFQSGSQGGGLSAGGQSWYRIATASDPGSTFTMSWTGSTPSTDQIWWDASLVAYGGAAGSPIDVQGQNSGGFSGTVSSLGSCPSKVTGQDNDWAVYLCSMAVGSSGTITGVPASTTQRENSGNSGICSAVSDSNGSVGLTGSSIGGGSFTSSAQGSWTVYTVGLAPAAPPPEAPTVLPQQIPHPLWTQLVRAGWERNDWQAQGSASLAQQHWRLMDGLNGRPGIGSSGTQPPATGTANSGAGVVNGFSFYTSQGGLWFEGYWYYCCASGQSTSPAKFALWSYLSASNGGDVVPGTVVTSGTLTAGAWNWVSLPKPVQLAIWGVYTAAVGVPINAGYPDTANQFGTGEPYSGGIKNGPLIAFSGQSGSNQGPPSGTGLLQCGQASGVSDPAAAYPGGTLSDANVWLDVQVTNTAPAGYNGSYRLWPNMADSDDQTSTDSAVNYVIGTEVITSQACVVNAIWYYVPAGQGSSGNQWATSADIWRVRDGVRVATQPNPVWINGYSGGVDGNSNAGRWVYTQLPSTVTLPAGDYYVTVYNNNGSPNTWGAKRFYYWQSGTVGSGTTYQTGAPGTNGITNGPLYAPSTPQASPTYNYANNGAAVPPWTDGTGNKQPGQSVFAVGPPNQVPYINVGNLSGQGPANFQNYWIDLEVTPASLYQPSQPVLPRPSGHPIWNQLLEVAGERFGWQGRTGAAGGVSVTLTTAQVNINALAPSLQEQLTLSVAQANINALAPSVRVQLSLPVAQVNINALAPSIREQLSLTTAQVSINALAPSIRQQLSLPVAQVNINTLAPGLRVQLGLPVARVNINALPVTVNVGGPIVNLTTAQVTIAALAPSGQLRLSLPVAQLIMAAQPVSIRLLESLAKAGVTINAPVPGVFAGTSSLPEDLDALLNVYGLNATLSLVRLDAGVAVYVLNVDMDS